MSWKNRVIKYATVFVVFILILNPETFHLALFIDAAGLEILLLLFQIHIIAIGTEIYKRILKSLDLLSHPGYWEFRIYQLSVFSMSKEAIMMHVLVFSAIISFVVNVI